MVKGVRLAGLIGLPLLTINLTAAGDQLTIGGGIGYAPDYRGSDEYQAVPLPSFEYQADWGGIRSAGLGVEVDLIGSPVWSAGPVIRYDGGRNDLTDVDDAQVSRLSTVDGAVEIGGAVDFGVPLAFADGAPSYLLTVRLQAMQGLDGGHEGATGELSLGVLRPREDLTVGVSATATYADDDYMQSFFSITPRDAAAAGLARFEAGGGIRDVGVTGFVGRALTETWELFGIASYSRLVGDAADSPIVRDRGRADQLFLGLGVRYRVF